MSGTATRKIRSKSNPNCSNFAALAAAALDAESFMGYDDISNAVLACPPATAPRPDTEVALAKKHWIVIELVDEHGKPCSGEDFRITLPDGSVVEDSLDSRGKARIHGIDPGTCNVCFPGLDQQIWQRA